MLAVFPEVLGCTFDDYYDRLMSSSPGSYSQRIDEQTGMLQEYSNLSRNPSRTKPETAPLNGYANYSKSSSNKKRRKEDHSNGTLGEATKPSVEVVQIGSKLGVEVERVLSDFSELLPLLSPLRSPTRMPSPVKQEARLDSPFVAQTTSKSPAIDMNGLPEGGVCRLALSVMPIERRKLLYSKWKAKKEALRAERGERDKRVSDNLSEPRDSKPKADKHRSREPCRKDTPCIVDPKLTQRSHQTEAKPEINKTNNEDFHRVEEAKAALKQASQQSHSSKTGSAGDGGSRGVTRQEDSQFQSSHTSQPIKSSATSSNEKSTTKRDKDYLSKGLDSQHSRVPSPSTVPNIKIKKEIKDHPVDRQTPQPEQLSKAALPNGDSKPTPIPKKHHHKSGDGEERREDQRESGDDYSPKAKFLLEESLEESKRTKDGYRQMACTIKWKADKMVVAHKLSITYPTISEDFIIKTDRIEKTLSYLEAALHFVLSAFNTDDPKGCDVEKPGHQYESLSHALDFLRTSTGNFVNGKTDSTQMRHYRRRVKVVGSMLDACLSYQLYRIRSEVRAITYPLLKFSASPLLESLQKLSAAERTPKRGEEQQYLVGEEGRNTFASIVGLIQASLRHSPRPTHRSQGHSTNPG